MGKKGSRRCAYCGGSPVSAEHVLPQWLRKTPAGAESFANWDWSNEPNVRFRSDVMLPEGEEPVVVVEPFVRGKVIPNWEVKVKAPCKPCNNGWMSRLEKQAQPIIEPLMSSASAAIELGVHDVSVLRRWAIKTAAMFEFNDQAPTRTFSSDVFVANRDGDEPPGLMEVGLYWSTDVRNDFRLSHHGGALSLGRIGVGMTPYLARASVTVFSLHQLIFCVWYADDEPGTSYIKRRIDAHPRPLWLKPGSGATGGPEGIDFEAWSAIVSVSPIEHWP